MTMVTPGVIVGNHGESCAMDAALHHKRKQINRMTIDQAVELVDFIRKVCSRADGEAYAVYQPGWDDARIARTWTKFPVTVAMVKKLRQKCIGPVRQRAKKGVAGANSSRARINELQKRLAVLENWARINGFASPQHG